MARVAQTPQETARRAYNIVLESLNLSSRWIKEELQTDPPLDTTYQDTRNQEGKYEAANAHHKHLSVPRYLRF